ncbi:hypothetical protein M8494_20190 [Serratia ureilytica]
MLQPCGRDVRHRQRRKSAPGCREMAEIAAGNAPASDRQGVPSGNVVQPRMRVGDSA